MRSGLRHRQAAANVFGFGLSEALPASDAWKGSWKFELDRQDQPYLSYYETSGKTVFPIGCGAHFETDAVYPGAPPKQEHTPGSITIANGKTQMDFAGFIDAGPESFPRDTTWFNQPEPRLRPRRSRAVRR